MEKRINTYSLLGFIIVSITGTLLHFAYERLGKAIWVAFIAPINKSSWEHLKLLFFPYILFAIVEQIGINKRIIFCKAIGAICGMMTILTIFYTYTGIIGKSVSIINIASFFIGVIVAFLVDRKMILSGKYTDKFHNIIGIILIILTTLLFFLFTFMPPLIPLFRDPLSLTYGI